MGIVLAVLKLAQGRSGFISVGIPMVLEGGRWVDSTPAAWFTGYGQVFSLVAFVLLCGFVYWDARRQK